MTTNDEPLLVPCRTQDEEEAIKRSSKIDDLEVDLKSEKLTKDEFLNEVRKIY